MDFAGFKDWLVSRGRSPDTASLYEIHIRTAFEGYDYPTDKLLSKKLSAKTRRSVAAALRAWAKYDEDDELLEEVEEIKLPPDQRKHERPPLTREELKRFREVLSVTEDVPEPIWAVLGLMAWRGLRVGDALRLSRREVGEALKSGVLRYTAKGGRRLRAPIGRFREYLESLDAHRGWEHVYDLCAPSSVEDPAKAARRSVLNYCKSVAVEAGIDSNMYNHRLRRTYATLYLEAAKGDLTKLQAHMGWTSIATAASYSDYYSDEELDELAELV